jgi:hypothetical protein
MFSPLVELSPWLVIILVGLARARSLASVYVLAALVVIASRDPVRVDQAKYALDASTDTKLRVCHVFGVTGSRT